MLVSGTFLFILYSVSLSCLTRVARIAVAHYYVPCHCSAYRCLFCWCSFWQRIFFLLLLFYSIVFIRLYARVPWIRAVRTRTCVWGCSQLTLRLCIPRDAKFKPRSITIMPARHKCGTKKENYASNSHHRHGPLIRFDTRVVASYFWVYYNQAFRCYTSNFLPFF